MRLSGAQSDIKRKSKVKNKKRILIICPFPQGVAAGQRLKYEQYLDSWRKTGYDVVVSSFMDNALWRVVYTHGNFITKIVGVARGYIRRIRDIFRLFRFDIVYVFMWVTPVGTSLFERIFRSCSNNVIYDIEDNLLIETANQLNPFS